MKNKNSVLFAVMALAVTLYPTSGSAAILGTADDFGALGSSTVTNTGPSVVTGDVGVSAGTAIVGFADPGGPGSYSGARHSADAVAAQAQTDAGLAYVGLSNMSFTQNLTGQDLGNLTLLSGIYHFDSSAQLTGPLTLDGQGSNVAYWVFQIGSTLTTASASTVSVINPATDSGVYWQVGSSATLGTESTFIGNILANNDITLTTGADILCGSALALNGAVTMDTNRINALCDLSSGGLGFSSAGGIVANSSDQGGPGPAAPEPVSMSLFLLGGGALAARKLRQKKDACHKSLAR